MELFQRNGHLSEDGLRAIVNGSLDELKSLEAAEHLSFCDDCLARYTALLEGDTLLTPPSPLREPVMQKVRKRKLRFLFSKSATIAAAAVLAVTMWAAGVMLPSLASQQPTGTTPQQTSTEPRVSLGSRLDNFAEGLSSSLDTFFGDLFSAGTPSQELDTRPKEEDIRRREDVFSTQDDAENLPDDTTST